MDRMAILMEKVELAKPCCRINFVSIRLLFGIWMSNRIISIRCRLSYLICQKYFLRKAPQANTAGMPFFSA
jgi:hypothetical protein